MHIMCIFVIFGIEKRQVYNCGPSFGGDIRPCLCHWYPFMLESRIYFDCTTSFVDYLVFVCVNQGSIRTMTDPFLTLWTPNGDNGVHPSFVAKILILRLVKQHRYFTQFSHASIMQDFPFPGVFSPFDPAQRPWEKLMTTTFCIFTFSFWAVKDRVELSCWTRPVVFPTKIILC